MDESMAYNASKGVLQGEHCKRGYLKSNVVANPTQILLLDQRSVKMQLSSLKRKAAFYLSGVPFVLHLQRKPLNMPVFACRTDHGTSPWLSHGVS